MTPRPVIDVSGLPESVLDHRSLIWWGNLLLLGIETTIFALLIAAYYYVRLNFSDWPPPRPQGPVGLFNPVPSLGIPTLTLGALLLSLAPTIVADLACLRKDRRVLTIALAIFMVVTLGAIALRCGDFAALHFRWDDNAYASVAWTVVGLHLLHMTVGFLEMGTMLAWVVVNGLDDKHARDVRVTAVYWYWIVGTWIVLYAIVFLSPRLS